MKKLLTLIAVSAFALVGTTVQADARPQYNNGSSSYRGGGVYVSKSYSYGSPRYVSRGSSYRGSNYRSSGYRSSGYRSSGYRSSGYRSGGYRSGGYRCR